MLGERFMLMAAGHNPEFRQPALLVLYLKRNVCTCAAVYKLALCRLTLVGGVVVAVQGALTSGGTASGVPCSSRLPG